MKSTLNIPDDLIKTTMSLSVVALEENLLLFSLDSHFQEIAQYLDLSLAPI